MRLGNLSHAVVLASIVMMVAACGDDDAGGGAGASGAQAGIGGSAGAPIAGSAGGPQPRTDGGPTGDCHSTESLRAYCSRSDSLCGLDLVELEARLCSESDGTFSTAVRRTSNTCGGTTLTMGSWGYTFHFDADQLVGVEWFTDSFCDATQMGGISAAYGRDCQQVGMLEELACGALGEDGGVDEDGGADAP